CLRKSLPYDRHRCPIGFKEEKAAIAVALLILEIQSEHAVRNDAKIQPAVYLHSPPKQLMLSAPVECKRKFSLREKSNPGLSARKFNGHHHVCNQKRMFKKYSPGIRVVHIR